MMKEAHKKRKGKERAEKKKGTVQKSESERKIRIIGIFFSYSRLSSDGLPLSLTAAYLTF
jgi:hypothetical protein